MNYIRHLNGFFVRLSQDQRMTPYHVSLYLALFQLWNLNRFKNPFTISRDETMKLSLIGSEGFLMASIWLVVPFFILAFLLWIFPPWKKTPVEH